MTTSSSGSPDPRDRLVERLVQVCSGDARVQAVLEGGSRARGEADEHSDVDVTVLVADNALNEILAGKAAFVRTIGDALFVEDFGMEQVAFAIFADGSELELRFFAASALDSIRAGPHRTLLDPAGVLEGRTFPGEEPDAATRSRQLREVLMWFWHDLGHFTTAIARGQLWWAAGQLEQLRNSCVNLVRLEQGGEAEDEPYWKLDAEIATGPLDDLRPTFVPVERNALLAAGHEILTFFREHGRSAADAGGLAYPEALDELIGGRLDDQR